MAETVKTETPIIETERLRIRGHRADDHAAAAAMWADPEVVRHIGGGKPSTAQQTWMRILQYAGHWRLMGFGYWVVEDRASGRFVGEVGFADFKRDLDPSITDGAEIGWALAPEWHGRGYASEAVRAAIGWAERSRDWKRTYGLIRAENVASLRLATKLGFREERTIVLDGVPLLVHARSLSPRGDDGSLTERSARAA